MPQEVEKEEFQEVPGKKARKRTIREMEYCHESELEGRIWTLCTQSQTPPAMQLHKHSSFSSSNHMHALRTCSGHTASKSVP